MKQRFFKADQATYEAVRSELDSAWGLPSHGQVTSIEPVATAPKGPDGLVYLATWDAFCEYEEASALLSRLIESGAVNEIDEAAYFSALQPEAL